MTAAEKESEPMEEIAYTYFEIGFGAYLTNLTACIIITASVMAIFRKVMKNKFRNSWTYAMWIILPLMIWTL